MAPDRQRLHLLWNGYAHAVQPPEAFASHEPVRVQRDGEPYISFASTEDPHYQALLEIIRQARATALRVPRVDMPGAEVVAGQCRWLVAPEPPDLPLRLQADITLEGAVALEWSQLAPWIGVEFELFRGAQPGFPLDSTTLIARTGLFRWVDWDAPAGVNYYALRTVSFDDEPVPSVAEVTVPAPTAPSPPQGLRKLPSSGTIRLRWQPAEAWGVRYHVARAARRSGPYARVTDQPLDQCLFVDWQAEPGTTYWYQVTALSRRDLESAGAGPLEAQASTVAEPMFVLPLDQDLVARRYPDQPSPGALKGRHRYGTAVCFWKARGMSRTNTIRVSIWGNR